MTRPSPKPKPRRLARRKARRLYALYCQALATWYKHTILCSADYNGPLYVKYQTTLTGGAPDQDACERTCRRSWRIMEACEADLMRGWWSGHDCAQAFPDIAHPLSPNLRQNYIWRVCHDRLSMYPYPLDPPAANFKRCHRWKPHLHPTVKDLI